MAVDLLDVSSFANTKETIRRMHVLGILEQRNTGPGFLSRKVFVDVSISLALAFDISSGEDLKATSTIMMSLETFGPWVSRYLKSILPYHMSRASSLFSETFYCTTSCDTCNLET